MVASGERLQMPPRPDLKPDEVRLPFLHTPVQAGEVIVRDELDIDLAADAECQADEVQ
jgi:hypothetical protein